MFRRFYLKPNQNKNPPKSICVLREKYQNLRDSKISQQQKSKLGVLTKVTRQKHAHDYHKKDASVKYKKFKCFASHYH